jgi:hypothetical protein
VLSLGAGEAPAAAIADRQGVYPVKTPPDWAAGQPTWQVAQGLMVALGAAPSGVPACTLWIKGGDPAVHRQALDKALADWRVPMTPAVGRFDPGRYASRDVLCGPPGGPHDAVLISTGQPGARPAMMITLLATPKRDRRCDAAG